MAFIKNNDSANSQSSIDVRNIFIGRTKELDYFVQEILQSENPSHNIISVWGHGGVGKSTLLTKFKNLAHGPDFKDYCLHAQVDERQVTPSSVMEKLADQLRIASYPLADFVKVLHQYKDDLRNLRARHDTEQESFVQSKIFETSHSMSLDNLSLYGTLQETDRSIVQNFEREYRYRQLFKDSERIDDPLAELTNAFISDLNRLANTPVALSFRQVKHQRRILLFFDTFEQLAVNVVPWLLDYFLEADISSNVVLIVAGRMVIDRSIQSYQRRWQKHKSTIYPILLDSFTEAETRDYLTAQGITEPTRISPLLRLSRGLPYSLSLLTTNVQGEVDVTKDVVDNFLRGIPETEDLKRRLALEAALLTRPFNQDDLEAFTYLSENDFPDLYLWLSEQPFVRSNPQDGRHSYHDLARENFTRHLYQISPNQYQSTRKALVHHYRLLIEKNQVEAGKEIYKVPGSLELILALAHQLFLLPDEENHITAIEHILEVYRYTASEQVEEIIRFLRQISQGESTNLANIDARQIAEYLIQFIEASPEKREQEFLAATSFLLKRLSSSASSNPKLLAWIYRLRGNTFRFLNKYQQAIDDFKEALEHDSSYVEAYISRSNLYLKLDRYDDALIDLNLALQLQPTNPSALVSRGQVHQFMKHFEEALYDFECVTELNTKLKFIGHFLQGNLLCTMGRDLEAITSLTAALVEVPTFTPGWIELAKAYRTLHSRKEVPRLLQALSVPKVKSASVIISRAEAMNAIGCYEEAITECTRAIDLKAKGTRVFIQRGFAYGERERYEEAINDFTLALKLKSNDGEALIYRGQTYHRLERYSEALNDFNTVLVHESNLAPALFCRSLLYKSLRRYDEALRDLGRVKELDKDFGHRVQEQISEVLWKSGKKEESLKALMDALKMETTCSNCWGNLALSYGHLYPRREIPSLLRKVTGLDENNLSMIASRGAAMSRVRCFEEALLELTHVIEVDPNNEEALAARSQTYIQLDCYKEALQDLDRIIERSSDVTHAVQERRGKALQELGRNEEALNAFMEALKTKTTCSACWTNLVVTHEAMEDRSNTAQWLRELSEFYINRAAVLAYQAEALAATRHFEEALMMFTEALKLRPDDVKILIGQGQVYSELKRYEEALADFNKALILRPDYAETILRHGQTYRCMKRFPEALKDFDLVIKLDSDFEHEGHEEKGSVLQSLQRHQAAISSFTQALKIEPTCIECWTELGRAYEALYTRSEVPKFIREVSISSGDKALAITSRAKALTNMGFYQEALIDFDHAFSLDETIVFEASTDRGLVLSYLARYPEAIECYKQSSKYNSSDYQALYNIAVAMTRWKGFPDAQKHIDVARDALLEKVHTVHGSEAFYGLGGLAALMGNTEQAFDYLQRALSIGDEDIIEWMQRDMAWFDLRSDARFQTLIFNVQQKTWNPAAYYQVEREEQQQRPRDDTAILGSTNTLMSPETLPLHTLRVFLCYSPFDRLVVRDLYRRLQANGIDPWLDEVNLLPGQEKETEIRKVVRASDAVIVCLSRNSTQKAGHTHKEINYALDIADEQPEGTIFLIPVKLEECNIPERLSRLHSVNLFDAQGYDRLIDALRTKFSKFNAT